MQCSVCSVHRASGQCDGCGRVHYCSIACQTRDWPRHATQCGVGKQAPEAGPEALRQEDSLDSLPDDAWALIMAMDSVEELEAFLVTSQEDLTRMWALLQDDEYWHALFAAHYGGQAAGDRERALLGAGAVVVVWRREYQLVFEEVRAFFHEFLARDILEVPEEMPVRWRDVTTVELTRLSTDQALDREWPEELAALQYMHQLREITINNEVESPPLGEETTRTLQHLHWDYLTGARTLKLVRVPFQRIPATFTEMVSLQTLNALYTGATAIDGNWSTLVRLEDVNFRGAAFPEVPRQVLQLPALLELEIVENQVLLHVPLSILEVRTLEVLIVGLDAYNGHRNIMRQLEERGVNVLWQ